MTKPSEPEFSRGERFWRASSRIVLGIAPRPVVEVLATVFGLLATLAPLTLWVAWTQTIFLLVLASSVLAAALSALLAMATAPRWADPEPRPRVVKRGGFAKGEAKGKSWGGFA